MTQLQWVWLTLAVMIVPLGLLAALWRTYPTRRAVWVAVVPAVLALALLLREDLFRILMGINFALIAVAAVDWMTLPARRAMTATRHTGRVASQAKSHAVRIELSNVSRRALDVTIRDDAESSFHARPAIFDGSRIPARSKLTLEYVIRPTQRGAFEYEFVHTSTRSLLGLWRRIIRIPCRTRIHVYPDLKQLGEYALLARKNQLSQMGVRRVRRVGQDHDFERLRDYTLDDNYKHIDWRATARRQKLTVKDFQATRSQRVIFLVDCGRMMTNEDRGINLLDHSINAMLMLSYIALSQADAVGMIMFSSQVHRFVPPRTGMTQMTRLLHACFDRFPNVVESRYDAAFQYLATHCRKRSLVILITNLIDDVNAKQVERYMTNLVGRHLPLGVLLRDRRMFEAIDQASRSEDHLYRAGAAAEILLWRLQVMTDLQNKGALALDVFPEDMTAPLVNEYLRVKARHLL